MKIIRAQAIDTPLIAPLFDAYRQFYQADSDLAGANRFIHERLTRDESVIFLAMEDKDAIGFAQLYPLFASVAMKSLWLLNDLYVAPSVRRLGIGAALLKRAEELARESHSRGLFLRTAVDNETAQRLYERCGWSKDDEFFRYDRIIE